MHPELRASTIANKTRLENGLSKLTGVSSNDGTTEIDDQLLSGNMPSASAARNDQLIGNTDSRESGDHQLDRPGKKTKTNKRRAKRAADSDSESSFEPEQDQESSPEPEASRSIAPKRKRTSASDGHSVDRQAQYDSGARTIAQNAGMINPVHSEPLAVPQVPAQPRADSLRQADTKSQRTESATTKLTSHAVFDTSFPPTGVQMVRDSEDMHFAQQVMRSSPFFHAGGYLPLQYIPVEYVVTYLRALGYEVRPTSVTMNLPIGVPSSHNIDMQRKVHERPQPPQQQASMPQNTMRVDPSRIHPLLNSASATMNGQIADYGVHPHLQGQMLGFPPQPQSHVQIPGPQANAVAQQQPQRVQQPMSEVLRQQPRHSSATSSRPLTPSRNAATTMALSHNGHSQRGVRPLGPSGASPADPRFQKSQPRADRDEDGTPR